MEPWTLGAAGLGLVLTLIFLRVPIGFAFLVVGFLGIWWLRGLDPALALIGMLPYQYSTSYTLSAVPLFMFMGLVLFQAGVSAELFDMALKWVGKWPGGLNHAVVVACGIFGACTGSSTTGTAAFGVVALPEIRRLGYDERLSYGVLASAGSLGIMIPPSIPFLLYGLITEQSVAKLFMAGFLPGAVEMVVFMALIAFMVKRNPALAPPGPSFTWKERLLSVRGCVPVLFVGFVVLGGMYTGWFTPTEAAGVGCFAALALAALKRKLAGRQLSEALMDTLRLGTMIFFIIIGVMLFSSFLTMTGLPVAIGDWIAALNINRYAVLVLILLSYIPAGMFLDGIGMIMVTVPIYYPILTQLGFDPIWYGVILVMMIELGALTPPMSMNCFVMASVAKAPLEKVYEGIWPFIYAEAFVVALLVAFPDIALLIPRLMG